MGSMIYQYKGRLYPEYLKHGNAMQYIAPCALQFCKGSGFDIGCGQWPLSGATPIEISKGSDALNLPKGRKDFIFSSHCLEHLPHPVEALEHWKSRLREGGVLFLYLPHPDMEYWLPQNNRKHLHAWYPEQMEKLLRDLGLVRVIRSERDLAWSYAVVGYMPGLLEVADPVDSFRSLIEDSTQYFRDDPAMLSIFRTFGADAFRRSSMFDGLDEVCKEWNFRGKRCVEIGSFNGITAVILSRYFEEVVSIDIFPHTMKHAVAQHVGAANIRFVDVKDNEEKAKVIGEVEFDAAYVDGDHEKDTETDFAAVAHCGRVLFHEYWEQQAPVFGLVNELRLKGNVVTRGKMALWTRT